jgi:hypothetical protein
MTARVRLSRARGWRLPADAVKIDRSTPWGNPFMVGEHGSAADCVEAYRAMLSGHSRAVGGPTIEAQRAYRAHFDAHWRDLVGKRLACWCALDRPCHADALAEAVATLQCRAEEAAHG